MKFVKHNGTISDVMYVGNVDCLCPFFVLVSHSCPLNLLLIVSHNIWYSFIVIQCLVVVDIVDFLEWGMIL